MSTRRLLALALVAVALLLALAWQLRFGGDPAGPEAARLLPELEARLATLDSIELRGAGDIVRVRLEKTGTGWRVAERDGWPANEAAIGQLLQGLAKARQVEAKTGRADLHARLGVEAVSDAKAGGIEVRLEGGGAPIRVVVGHEHPRLGRSYARRADDDRAWLTDQSLGVERDPAQWLDRRLLDIPMARIERIEVAPATGRRFTLARVEGRFSLDGMAPVVMADPDRGNATAGFLDQLLLDDVGRDEVGPATQVARFLGLDGADVTISAWSVEERTWMRCRVGLDEARARAWLMQAEPKGDIEAGLATLRRQLDAAGARCQGRRFLLPAHKAGDLMRSREHYLVDD